MTPPQILPMGNVRLFRRIHRNEHVSPKLSDFRKKVTIFIQQIPICPENIPAYSNFAEFYRFSFYPKKLSYSSSNAYIKKIRARELGKASCLLKNFKNEFFVMCRPFSKLLIL